MESLKSPQRKSNEYHFCIKVTPKALSKVIFESKGIQRLYKLQIDKGSKKQTVETMRRNLHQQALEGFYRSQNCNFSLANYTNFRPYEMTITFSEVNTFNQEEMIFKYKFSTFGLVKNFLQNGVQRSTHVVTKDFETEFYIDFYIQSNKARLQDKVKYDSNKQLLKRKHFNQMEEDSKDSDVYKKSVTSNNTPSKSSHRNSSTVHYHLDKGLNTRSSTPLFQAKNGQKTKDFMDESFNDARSEKFSKRSMRSQSQTSNADQKEKKFLKKFPSTKLNYGDYVKEDDEDMIRQTPIFGKVQSKRQILSPKISEKKTMKYERIEKKGDQNEKKESEFDLKVFLNMREISLDEISYQIKKNILVIILVSIIFFIVASKAMDSVTFGDKSIQKRVQIDEDFEDNEWQSSRIERVSKNQRQKKAKKVKNPKRSEQKDETFTKQKVSRKIRKVPQEIKRF